jgi:hypothetical protein
VARQIVLYDADGVAIGIVGIDEFAHAFCIILGRAALGNLDLTPEPIGIEGRKA